MSDPGPKSSGGIMSPMAAVGLGATTRFLRDFSAGLGGAGGGA